MYIAAAHLPTCKQFELIDPLTHSLCHLSSVIFAHILMACTHTRQVEYGELFHEQAPVLE